MTKQFFAYDEAISVANGNELYAPVFMMKKATVLSAQQKYSDLALLSIKISRITIASTLMLTA